MNFIINESAQKLRGGYYTPVDIATFITRWVKEGHAKSILEPSCGDGAFLQALSLTGTEPDTKITGFELDPIEAKKAEFLSETAKLNAKIINADCLSWALEQLNTGGQKFDAVIGNPPFIRYQYLPENFQNIAEQIFVKFNCKFTKHTNAWVPFILASIGLLKPGGRLAMVIPSEIIHVLHAQSLRTMLGMTCRKLVIIDPEEIWFEGTLQGAVILMAEKKKSPDEYSEGLGILQVKGRSFLTESPSVTFNKVIPINGKTVEGKWTKAFLSVPVRNIIEEIENLPTVHRFKKIAKVDVGIVTGANNFFLVNDETVEKYKLQQWAHPMFGRSEHCPGVIYDKKQHKKNSAAGLPSNFIWFPEGAANQYGEVARYIALGETQDLHTRYKCRIRKCWYTVPSVSTSEIGMLKRSHDAPRLILNEAGAYTTDTAYRITALNVDARLLVSAFINPLTAISAELEGRTYGGGVLELVPSEIEKLLIPIPTKSSIDLQELNCSIKSRSISEALATYGSKTLEDSGITKQQSADLLDTWITLKNRRQRKNVEE